MLYLSISSIEHKHQKEKHIYAENENLKQELQLVGRGEARAAMGVAAPPNALATSLFWHSLMYALLRIDF